ncbi:Hypothetical protein ABZS17D1_02173 [Kosakonia cowanii]
MIQDGEKCNRKNHNHKTVFTQPHLHLSSFICRTNSLSAWQR